jgi:fimbrial isopeptide formation D2 family protein
MNVNGRSKDGRRSFFGRLLAVALSFTLIVGLLPLVALGDSLLATSDAGSATQGATQGDTSAATLSETAGDESSSTTIAIPDVALNTTSVSGGATDGQAQTETAQTGAGQDDAAASQADVLAGDPAAAIGTAESTGASEATGTNETAETDANGNAVSALDQTDQADQSGQTGTSDTATAVGLPQGNQPAKDETDSETGKDQSKAEDDQPETIYYTIEFLLTGGYTFDDGSDRWSTPVLEGETIPLKYVESITAGLSNDAEKPFLGWAANGTGDPISAAEVAATPATQSVTWVAVFKSDANKATRDFAPMAADWTTMSASAAIAAATGSGNYILVGPNETAGKRYVNVNAALDALNSENRAGQVWLLYLGANANGTSGNTNRPEQAKLDAVTAATLVITGTAADPQPSTPTPANSAGSASILGNNSEVSFSSNILLRNIRYYYTRIYMRGHNLTLGHQSWATRSTEYYGGAASGSISGNPVMTVWSTGTGEATFVGGMRTGTLTGNVAININDSSNTNAFNIYGAGLGTSTSAKANLNGSVTTTITKTASTTSGTCGLGTYIGGVEYGDVSGKITNNISGVGRFAHNSYARNDLYFDDSYFMGGSRNGNIGTTATRGTDIIVNSIYTNQWTYGAAPYVGTNMDAGVVNGNVVNTVKAGDYQKGSFSGISFGSGYSADDYSSSYNNLVSTALFNTSTEVLNLSASSFESARANAEARCVFKQYGNLTNNLLSGCVYSYWSWNFHVRGAGYGYVQGNATTNVGAEGLVYSGTHRNSSMWSSSSRHYVYSGSTNNQGYRAGLEFSGGGGMPDNENSIFLVGNTELNLYETVANWVYAGNFSGAQIGSTIVRLYGGVVDTLEGGGYSQGSRLGNTRVEVHGGQVDWFLSGGGWNDRYTIGNASVEVYDSDYDPVNHPVRVNASMGGTYGISTHHVYTGDVSVIVHGGDFSGTSRGINGFSAGASNIGRILGNATMTIDLRGNKNGFKLGRGDTVSASRREGVGYYSYLGKDSSNTVTLNVFADASAGDLLNGLNIYGDAANHSPDNTRAGRITINVNAPGGKVGNLYASNYSNIVSGRLRRDVVINLVSAAELQGLSSCNPSDNITAAIVNASNNKAVINVGPQAQPDSWDSRPVSQGGKGEWPLNNLEPGLNADGFPKRINVTTNGVKNFSTMNISNRLLIAKSGSILNSGSANASNHRSSYNTLGNVNIENGSGLGVESGSFIAGKLTVKGHGYVVSPGSKNQIIFSDVDFPGGTGLLTWLRAPHSGTGSVAETTGLQTNWFNVGAGWPVITLNSGTATGSSAEGKTNVRKLTPANFNGQDIIGGKTYIGDNDTHFSTGDPDQYSGYGVCIRGSFYKWNVVAGDDASSLGTIAYEILNASGQPVSGSIKIGTTPPASGGPYLDVYGTSMPGIESTSGSIAIPTSKAYYPKFTFTPNDVAGEWVYDLTVGRSDRYDVLENPPNVSGKGLYDYHEFEQSIADYVTGSNRVRTWAASAGGRATGTYQLPAVYRTLPANQDDKEFSFDITVDYTNMPELSASSVILREREAQALVYSGVTALPDDDDPSDNVQKDDAQIIQGIYGVTSASGRPFLSDNIDISEAVEALGLPLGESEASRTYKVRYATHDKDISEPSAAETLVKEVSIFIVPNDATVTANGKAALVASDATMRVADAMAIVGQSNLPLDSMDATYIDWWTGAKAIIIDDDGNLTETAAILTDADAKVAELQGMSAKGEVALEYSYTVDSQTIYRNVVAYVLGAKFSGILFEDTNGDGNINASETVRLSDKTVELYAADGTLVASTETSADGAYVFGASFADSYAINAGDYYVLFPDLSPMGITTPYNYSRRTADLTVSWTGTYEHVANAGYKLPGGITELEDSLSKLVWDPTANSGLGGFVPGRIITNSQEVLEYCIQFTLPADLTGYQSLRVNDLLPAGLVYAADADNPFVIRVGGTTSEDGSDLPGFNTALLSIDESGVSYLITDFTGLSGQTINAYIKAKLQKIGGAGGVGGSYPTEITNKAQLILNAGSEDPGLGGNEAEGPEIKNGVAIAGTLFNDANRNGIFDAGEGVVGAGLDVVLYDASDTTFATPLATVVAAANGTFAFDVLADGNPISAGSYVVKYPAISGFAYVLSAGVVGAGGSASTNIASNDGASNVIVLDIETNQQAVSNAGYATPDPVVVADIKGSLQKQIWDPAADGGAGAFVNNRSVTDFSEQLKYKISFTVPAKPEGAINAFAGFSAIELSDVIEPGLAFADASVLGWNYQVLVGSTVIYSGIATADSDTCGYTFDVNTIASYLASTDVAVGTEVSLIVLANVVAVDGSWPTDIVNHGYLDINNEGTPEQVNLNVGIAGLAPEITFTQIPLVITQTPGVSHVLDANELKANMQVTDDADYPVWTSDAEGQATALFAGTTALPHTPSGTIDTQNVGVYKVRYTATDSHGNSTTAFRAVVVTDGRYKIENGVIIGARDFVVQSAAVQGTVDEVRSRSFAEAYDDEGTSLSITPGLFLKDGIPTGYVSGAAVAGTYDFVWMVNGYDVQKPIQGHVVDADVVDPGTKDSQYAIYASNFKANTVEAQDILDNDLFVTWASAYVKKLVASAPDAEVYIADRGGFAAVQNDYQIKFTIHVLDTPDYYIPEASQKAIITATVSDGNGPVLVYESPLEVWIGSGGVPAGSVSADDYTIMYGVTAADIEDGDITSLVTANPVGPEVDTAKVGTYRVSLQVTDSDHNTVSGQRLVVVNDGRYVLGKGRVLYAKGFVIAASDVSDTDPAREAQVRALSALTLRAGEHESEFVPVGTPLDASQTSIVAYGGYTAAEGTYSIAIEGIDYPDTEPVISRTITAEVVDAEVVVTGPIGEDKDTYYVFGNNISLTPLEADSIRISGDPEAELLAALGAGARKADPQGTLTDVGAIIVSDDGFIARPIGTQDTGEFDVVISDSDGVKQAVLHVSVAAGRAPQITAPSPLVIPLSETPGTLTQAQLMTGVTAVDPDGNGSSPDVEKNITADVIIDCNKDGVADMPSIPANIPSVTQVIYRVTDEAGNSVTASRAVIVDDGSFIYDNGYIISAYSFLIKVGDVDSLNKAEQIKTLSSAKAWAYDGTAVDSAQIVVNDGAYMAAKGTYKPKLNIAGHASPVREITAIVVDDDKEIENGDSYSIAAADFVINVIDANILAADAAYVIEDAFIARAGVQSYRRANNMDFNEGTKQVVSAEKQGTGASFISLAGLLTEGDIFDVTFWVDEDHSATVTVKLLISNRTAPTLTVPAVKFVAAGDAFNEGAYADLVPSYMQGVSATDNEDGPLAASAITHDNPVDTAVERGVYTVTYSVTDSDHNATSAQGMVLVGEWVLVGDFAISAHDFAKQVGDVTGTEAEVLTESEALAIDLRRTLAGGLQNPNFGKETAIVVTDFGGYVSGLMPGEYDITIAIAADTTQTKVITAIVGKGSGPMLTFTQLPLVLTQTPGVSHILSADELKVGLQVTDEEEYPVWISDADGQANALFIGTTATPQTPSATIDTQNVGVYKVSYTATDSHGNATTAYRAVVVTDGRYIIEDEDGDGDIDIIIGARNFVVNQSEVIRSEADIKNRSFAEAFDAEGTEIAVALYDFDGTGEIPAAYQDGIAPAGNYPFVWKANGHVALKAITGLVIVADDLDEGDKDSQYALAAKNFIVNIAQAEQMLVTGDSAFVSRAQVVAYWVADPAAGSPVDANIVVLDRTNFLAAAGTYPLSYGVSGTPLSVTINGVVSDGLMPVLSVDSPVVVWIGALADRPAGTILSADYSNLDGVSAIDPDGAGKASDPAGDGSDHALDITSSVQVISGAVDVTKVGNYTVGYSVKDADDNEVFASRLVVVNDGRYVVGNGRVLFAKPFVIRATDVATSETDKVDQVRANTKASLFAGSDELGGTHAGDLISGASPSLITFPNLGGYSAAQGSYTITVSGVDYPTGTILRNVTAEVIDADVIESGPVGNNVDTYYVYGNNIVLTPLEADAIQAAGDQAAQNQALLTMLSAGARKTTAQGNLITLTPVIANDDNFFARATGVQATGTYYVEVADPDGVVSATLRVIVASGNPPQIVATSPLVIGISDSANAITLAQLLDGVSATDVEDGDITGKIIIDQDGDKIADIINIPGNVPSVTKVTYSVTDSAGNTVTVSRAVIVNDGSYEFNDKYILWAASFVVAISEVNMADPSAQIKLLSDAVAWQVDGTPLPTSDISVTSLGGYKATLGKYNVELSLAKDLSLKRKITALVYDDSMLKGLSTGSLTNKAAGGGGYHGKNGVIFSIIARDFIISVQDANNLAGYDAGIIKANLMTLADVQSYRRSSDMSAEDGTKNLVSVEKQGTGAYLGSLAGMIVEGDIFEATFWVDEDHSAIVTIRMIVSNGDSPVLVVPAFKWVNVGDAFTESDYMQGVSAHDTEDGAIDASAISHDTPVDTTKEGFYKVTYSVTDTVHNVTTASSMVVVGNYIIVPGTNYVIAGKSPIYLTLGEVAAANADLTAAASIKAWKTSDASWAATTLSPAQIPATAGEHVVRFAVQADPNTYLDVRFIVGDDRLSVSYYANGATSGFAPATSLHAPGSQAVVADQGSLKREGYDFGGWAFTGNGGAAYQPGQTFNIYEHVRLFAVWTPISQPYTPPTIIVQPPTVVAPPPNTIYVQGPTNVVTTERTVPEVVEINVPYPVPEPAATTVPAPQTPTTSTNIPEQTSPLANLGSWSLLSLLLAMISFIAAAVLAVLSLRRRNRSEVSDYDQSDEKNVRNIGILNSAICLLGLAPAVILFILDDITAPMTFINGNTLFVAIAFVVVVALIAVRLAMGRPLSGDPKAGATLGFAASSSGVAQSAAASK